MVCSKLSCLKFQEKEKEKKEEEMRTEVSGTSNLLIEAPQQ